jgi:hypothetical protein
LPKAASVKVGPRFYTYDGKKKSINNEVGAYVKSFVERDLKSWKKRKFKIVSFQGKIDMM